MGVRVSGDYAIEFTLERPASHFAGIAGLWMARPVPREVIEQFGERWTEPGNIWTNGPYALARWEHDRSMLMLKNPHYYNAKSVTIERIAWSMISHDAERLAQYKGHKLDAVTLSSRSLESVRADPELAGELQIAPGMGTYFFAFNVSKPPFDSPLVRRAFSHALDRQALVGNVLEGGGLPARTFASPGIWGNPADDPAYVGIKFDPALARKLLADAGYPDGQGLPEVTLYFNADRTHEKIAQFVVRSWKQVLGVDVKLVGQEWKQYYRTVTQGPPQIFRPAWAPDYPDEGDWLLAFHSGHGELRTRWRSPEFDALLEQATLATDPAARRRAYARAEEILCVEEAVVMPLYHDTRPVLSRSYVERTYSLLGAEHVDRWRVVSGRPAVP